MSENQHWQYKPGDIVNGHVLGSDGQWYPQPQVAAAWTPPPNKPKPVWGRWYMITGYVVVGLFVVAGLAGGGDTEPSAANTDSNKSAAKAEPSGEKAAKPAVMKVDAEVILDEFEGNEAAADAKYKGKTLAVTGTVDKVDTELWDDEQYVIQLSDGSDFAVWTVNCNDVSASDAAKVRAGSEITVTGEFDDGGDLGVELKNCTP